MKQWSTMEERVTEYLQDRRAMGYELRIEGEQLYRFARFADQQQITGPVTTDLAVAWANATKSTSNIAPARRLEVIRPFAKYCALFEPGVEVPLSNLLGRGHRRVTPYIYTQNEISALLTTTQHLHPTNGLRPVTMHYLIGLLAATGLRISEARHLHCADVDLSENVLTVRNTKFRKTRYVPIDPTVSCALQEYVSIRNTHVPHPADPHFFLFDNGHAVSDTQARYAFWCLLDRLGWRHRKNRKRPRLYDLRHTFACHRLLSWYKEGADVHSMIAHLSTYLGHAKVTDTYWYLSGIPELFAISTQRFEALAGQYREISHEPAL